jgi:dTDP-4-amino-4,6-dideoxygalactose transaminase
MNPLLPFNKSSMQGRELEYIQETINVGQIAGDQIFSKKCQTLLESIMSVKRTLVTTSCTHALEMAAILLNIQQEDEVILPAFTFVSTANAFVLRGARPVFCDIRPDTLNLDESKLKSLITPRTRVIVPVHYAGVGCEMDEILRIAEQHEVAVVEDNAHGLFGKYRGRWLGTFGCLAAQSFHETKNITCGEGGAILINDTRYIERAEIIREKGTNRARFFRGQVDKYSWVDLGSSYVMSDVLAAFLYGQLEKWEEIQVKRRHIWMRYDQELNDWAEANGIKKPFVPDHCEQAWHMYYLLMPSLEERNKFIENLRNKGVMAVFHYQPLNQSYYITSETFGSGLKNKSNLQNCPIAEDICNRIVRLPFYTSMSLAEQQFVVKTILSSTL